MLTSFSASSIFMHFYHISPDFFRSYCGESTIRADEAAADQQLSQLIEAWELPQVTHNFSQCVHEVLYNSP